MSDIASQYWASLPTADAAKEIWQHIERWGEHVNRSGKLKLWTTSLREYYAGSESGGEIGEAGDQGEISTIKINDYHSLGEKIVVAITAQPPHFEPKARNSDHKSMRQAIFANGLLEAARREKGLDDIDVTMVRTAHLSREAFSTTLWNGATGQDVVADPATGQIVKSGDIEYRTYHPLDVARDHLRGSAADHQWYAFRDWRNRWDVAAEVPAQVEKVKSLQPKEQTNERYPLLVNINQSDHSDEVAVYTFVHDVTPAMPKGRLMRLCSTEVVLEDGPLPAEKMEDLVQRLVPEEQIGTEAGYTPAFDLLAPAHAQNSAYSTLLTIHSTFGGQLIWAKPGSVTGVEEVTGGYKLIKATEKPEPLSLVDPQATKEAETFAGLMGTAMERVSGVNAVSRGSPEALIKGSASGAALALLDAKTLESIRGLQQGRVRWLCAVATATVRQFRRNAQAKQALLVLGKANRNFLRDVNGEDVADIERVIVDLGNPLAQTTSGRLQILQTLMQLGDPKTGTAVIKTPEHVFEVLTTGRLEPAMEADAAELLNIRSENESLSEYKPVEAAFTDHHPMHMREHRSVLASPEARSDPKLIEAVQGHMDQHANLWRTTDPAILMALNIPPPPPPPGPPAGMAPAGPAEPGGPPGALPAPEGAGAEPMPNLPKMPIVAGTQERAPAPMPPQA